MANKPHHMGDYKRRARAVRLAAEADPRTRCWQCGLTAAEHGQPWTAGHVVDGQVGGELRPECRRCNYGRGAAMGNRQRGRRTTMRW
jgi:hypothetical protein